MYLNTTNEAEKSGNIYKEFTYQNGDAAYLTLEGGSKMK